LSKPIFFSSQTSPNLTIQQDAPIILVSHYRKYLMDVGGRLRSVRENQSMSQRDLAGRAGLTSAAISLIEQNKSSPSVASLKSLLDAIPMTMSEFFSEVEDESAPKYFYAASEFTQVSPDGSEDVSLRQVGDASRHALQMLHETYPPGADTGPDLIRHEGEEAGVLIEGIIEITVADQIRVLNAGDGYLFDSRLPHRFRNIGDGRCVIVSACTPPSF